MCRCEESGLRLVRAWRVEEIEGFGRVEGNHRAGVNEVFGAVWLGEDEAGDVRVFVEEEGFVGGCVGGGNG